MFYYTYILISRKDNRLYIGCTKDLISRVAMHNSGSVASTKERLPLELIYYEACRNKNDAFRREKYLKSGYGHRWIKTRIKDYNSERKVNKVYQRSNGAVSFE